MSTPPRALMRTLSEMASEVLDAHTPQTPNILTDMTDDQLLERAIQASLMNYERSQSVASGTNTGTQNTEQPPPPRLLTRSSGPVADPPKATLPPTNTLVFSWGSSTTDTDTATSAPTRIERFDRAPVVDVVGTATSMFALTATGAVYASGNNDDEGHPLHSSP